MSLTDGVLIAFLLGFPEVSTVVDTRAYPYGLLPQKRDGQISAEMPALTVNNISELSHHTADFGGRPVLSNYTPQRFQIDIYANDGAAVVRLGTAIRTALDGFTGQMGLETIGGAWRRVTTPVERIPDNLLFHRSMDYIIHTMGVLHSTP